MEESRCSVNAYCCKLTWFIPKPLILTAVLSISSLAIAPKAMLLICSGLLQLRTQVWTTKVAFHLLESKHQWQAMGLSILKVVAILVGLYPQKIMVRVLLFLIRL